MRIVLLVILPVQTVRPLCMAAQIISGPCRGFQRAALAGLPVLSGAAASTVIGAEELPGPSASPGIAPCPCEGLG